MKALPGRRSAAVILLAIFAISGANAPPVAAQDRPAGRTLGTFRVTAYPVEILDANPAFTEGRPYGQLSAADIAGISTDFAGRAGTTADGESVLLLRAQVSGPGQFACTVPAEERDGTCRPLAVSAFSDGSGAGDSRRYIAAAIYTPPENFGPGAGPTPAKYRGEVETRAVNLRLTFSSANRPAQTMSKRIVLARPPLVLVHGTFDEPDVWLSNQGGRSFVESFQTAGFKTFNADYGSDGFLQSGGTNQAAFDVNRKVVWKNQGGIQDALDYYRKVLGLAATQVDLVGHSMGGILARVYASPNFEAADEHKYKRPANFDHGDINRIVTLCSPHHGSPIPNLLAGLRKPKLWESGPLGTTLAKLAWLKQYFTGTTFHGAVKDQLLGSEALKKIGATPIPAYAIGCIAGAKDADDVAIDPDGVYKQRIEDLSWLFHWAPGVLFQYLRSVDMEREAELLPRVLDAFHSLWFERLGLANVGWLTAPEFPPETQMHKVPALQEVFRAMLFRYHENDYTVGLASQQGGLPEEHRHEIRGILHGAAPSYWKVQKRIIDILKEDSAIPGESFSAQGFPEAGQLIPPAPPTTDLIAHVEDLARDDKGRLPSLSGATEPRSKIIALLTGMPSDAIEVDDEAIRWSGLVPAHVPKFFQVARESGMVLLFRPVNHDATRLIAEVNAATKGMNVKAKSANWGPQRGYLPIDQAFSKKAGSAAAEIAAFDCDAYGNIKGGLALAKDLVLKIDGKSHLVCRTRQSSGPLNDYDCKKEDKKWVPTEDFIARLEASLPEGQPPLKLFEAQPGVSDCTAWPGAPGAEDGKGLLPLKVLADTEQENYMTADYDLLAIASQVHDCDPPGEDDMDPEYGGICDWQIGLLKTLNGAVTKGTCPYSGGKLIHHGPENQFFASPYVDYPVTAVQPAWKDDPERIVAFHQGPDGFRDMHLKQYFAHLKRLGWILKPNEVAPGWQWGPYDEDTGYELRDRVPPAPDQPDEITPPKDHVDYACVLPRSIRSKGSSEGARK